MQQLSTKMIVGRRYSREDHAFFNIRSESPVGQTALALVFNHTPSALVQVEDFIAQRESGRTGARRALMKGPINAKVKV